MIRLFALALALHAGPAMAAVVTQGGVELDLISELSGEGSTWLAYHHFRLSADHSQLTDVTSSPGLVRHRCPPMAR